MEKVGNFLVGFLSPSDWPKEARRAFVWTIPLSGPLYLIAWPAAFLLAVLVGSLFRLIDWSYEEPPQ